MRGKLLLLLGALSACGPTTLPDGGGTGPDEDGGAGSDAGIVDAGISDAGSNAGLDAGQDAGTDAGLDTGADAGADAGLDAGQDAGSDGGFVRLVVRRAGPANGHIDVTPGGSCSAECTFLYDAGTHLLLRAVPDQFPVSDAGFAGWEGDCQGRDASCALTMDGDKDVTAGFATGYFPCGDTYCSSSSELCVAPCCGGVPQPDGGMCTPPPKFCTPKPSSCSNACGCFASDPCGGLGSCSLIHDQTAWCVCA